MSVMSFSSVICQVFEEQTQKARQQIKMFIYKVQKHPGRTEQGNDGKNAEDLEGSVDGEKLS